MTRVATFYSVRNPRTGQHCGHRHRSHKAAADCLRKIQTNHRGAPGEVVIVGGGV